ncbi:hypothetical protein KIL84_008699 [Mauremys mutica]|uniref:Uncharacterized protein n=1 Tax=Mauremys mutica TaxID=74926 RepID=A0A9D3X852_9SAUR|nr:hypothetical protein KIL84_008699 [Mauremys mutica]
MQPSNAFVQGLLMASDRPRRSRRPPASKRGEGTHLLEGEVATRPVGEEGGDDSYVREDGGGKGLVRPVPWREGIPKGATSLPGPRDFHPHPPAGWPGSPREEPGAQAQGAALKGHKARPRTNAEPRMMRAARAGRLGTARRGGAPQRGRGLRRAPREGGEG